jgi:hypothetical protein
MYLSLILAALVAISIVIYFLRRDTKDTRADHVVHPLRNPENRPSEQAVEHYLGNDKTKLFQSISSGFETLGEPILSWKGPQNGWALALRGQETNGCLLLTRDVLIGYLGLTNNQLMGMRTDERFPEEMLKEINLIDLLMMDREIGLTYKEIPITAEKHAKAFLRLVELSIAYDNY